MAQLVKNLPVMQETWIQSLGWEDPLEKIKATHSSILAWRSPWTVLSVGSQRVGHDWVIFTSQDYKSLQRCQIVWGKIIIAASYVYGTDLCKICNVLFAMLFWLSKLVFWRSLPDRCWLHISEINLPQHFPQLVNEEVHEVHNKGR